MDAGRARTGGDGQPCQGHDKGTKSLHRVQCRAEARRRRPSDGVKASPRSVVPPGNRWIELSCQRCELQVVHLEVAVVVHVEDALLERLR